MKSKIHEHQKNNSLLVSTTTILLLFLALTGCNKDSTTIDPLAKLPPETQIGANTFGCIINDQVFYPRDGSGNFGGGIASRGLINWGDPSGNQTFNEIDCSNSKDGKPASKMIIHLQGLAEIGVGEYIWKTSNFSNSIDGLQQNYLYVKVYNSLLKTYSYYGSYENSGKVIITRYDPVNFIFSGVFSGRLKKKNDTEELEICQGRFDINKVTLSETSFP